MKKIALLLCASLLALSAAQAQNPADKPSTPGAGLQKIEDFFAYPRYSEIQLSPDGQFLAALAPDKTGKRMLAVIDLNNMQAKIVAHFNDAQVFRPRWVNNKRLVYSVTEQNEKSETIYQGGGLYAVDRDGTNERQLIYRRWRGIMERKIASRTLDVDHDFFSAIPQAGTDDIYVTQVRNEKSIKRSTYNLVRLNTVDGKATPVQKPGQTTDWVLDNAGQPRIAITYDDGQQSAYYREGEDSAWRKLASWDSMKADFTPLQLGADGALYVKAPKQNGNKALYRFNLQKNALEKTPLIDVDGFDFNGRLVFDKNGRLLGAHLETDAPGTVWFDEKMRAIQDKVDQLLPGKANRLQIPHDSPRVLVQSSSDTDPGSVWLYEIASGNLSPVAKTMPQIDPAQMAQKDFIRYKARDGLEIPGYLTLPRNGKKNLPMVLMVHGGPFVRGVHWRWEATSQFLASRGYAVLEPEFRGSAGYGAKLYESGKKEWGYKMQDDLVDAVKWAVSQGYADPKRICIAGASYGGYAVLWGLIRDPDLFQCGISWVGVSDINLMFNISWSDINEEGSKYYAPEYIGDLEKDAGRLKAVSPLHHAQKLKKPLILAYGGLDLRVPIVHGTKFYHSVKEHNPQVEWLEYKDEGHGWYFLDTNVDFWSRAEKFLDKHIGPNAK
ncbi:S9 family peptidase [Massilia sp. W12]|uniref:S9 family peptidase n=1 Tax=Massilia sp. W12 TaxID=3126507 RepID=UPI0030D05477